MKKNVLFIMLLYAGLSNGQVHWDSLVSINNQWNVYNYDGLDIPAYDEMFKLEKSDSNGVVNYKLLKSNDKEGEQWIYIKKILKQDSQKVWLYYDYEEQSEPYLLYDFALEKGDTFISLHGDGFKMVVEETDSILLLDGSRHKRLRLSCYPKVDEIGTVTWIEGVGDARGLLITEIIGCSLLQNGALLCFYKDGELVWDNPDWNGCWIMGLEEIEQDGFKIFPNPATDELKVQMGEWQNNITWTIFDMTGQKMLTGHEKDTDAFTITGLNVFNKGLYFIRVEDEKGKIYVSKFVKQE